MNLEAVIVLMKCRKNKDLRYAIFGNRSPNLNEFHVKDKQDFGIGILSHVITLRGSLDKR